MNLLNHEMLIAGLLRGLRIPFNLYKLLFNLVTVQIVEGNLSLLYPAQLHIADIIYISRMLQNRRHIRRNIGFSVSHSQNHGAVFSRHIDLFRIIPEHDSKRIGTADTHHGMVQCVHRRPQILFIIIIHQLNGHLCIRFRIETVSVLQKLLLQLLIIFNNSIVNADNGSLVIAVGMRIVLRRLSMSRPAGMPDTAVSHKGLTAVRLLIQHLQTSLCLYHLNGAVAVTDRQACRVIASVFQLGKTVQQHRRRLPVSHKANNSTHR